ncbi:hypothetical protein [Nocardia australiensis]|uniref:hypothetical protein n=1 Tax=Nocardia australiensis TaxID=2887191 RepID=UPI001D15239A|nr:hypothetical protein [Nocardia australiensis]
MTPFALVRAPGQLHEAPREHSYAVRRGETFPGLGANWVRIAVRHLPTMRQALTVVAHGCQEMQNVSA